MGVVIEIFIILIVIIILIKMILILLFFSEFWHIKFEKRKEPEKDLSKELMPVVWHPNRWWDSYISDDEKKKEINPWPTI